MMNDVPRRSAVRRSMTRAASPGGAMTRASFLSGGLAAGLLLAGCGAEGSSDETSAEGSDGGGAGADGSSALPEAEGTVSYPIELETDFGSTTLEARPERIAVISPATVDTDSLLALGATPVYAPDTIELVPWTPEDARSGVETFWTAEAGALPSAEEVLASSPDLIVALQAPEGFGQEEFDRFSEIAPVLMSDPSGPPLAWEDIVERLGDALDLSEAAGTLAEDVHAQIDQIAENNPEFEGNSAAHVHVYGEEHGAAYFSFPGSDSEALLERLGFHLDDNAETFSAENNQISDELVPEIDADVLLVTVNPTEGAEWFTGSPLFEKVPAVAEDRYAIYEPDPDEKFAAFAWAIRMPSPLSLPWAAEQLEELATEALG